MAATSDHHQPVRAANGIDEEGMLVFDEDRRLLAVLTPLSDDDDVAPGQWFRAALGEKQPHIHGSG